MVWESRFGRSCTETVRSGLHRIHGRREGLATTQHNLGQAPAREGEVLLVAQGYHGIHSGSAARRDVAGGERDQREQDGDSSEG